MATSTFAVTLDVDVAWEGVAADVADHLVDRLAHHGAAVVHLDGRLSVTLTMTVAAPPLRRPGSAIQKALDLIGPALVQSGARVTDIHAVEALTADEQDRRLTQPLIPALVGDTEAAELFGVTCQRLHQLRRQLPGFPAPVAEVRAGPLWTRAAIEAFAQSRSRRARRTANGDSMR